LKLFCWTSISKVTGPHYMGSMRLKHQRFFFKLFSIMKFLTPKFMKIKHSFKWFASFGNLFWIKLIIHGPSLTLRFKNMNELELFSEWGSSTKTPTLWNLQKINFKAKVLHVKSKWSQWRLNHVEPCAKLTFEEKWKYKIFG
jgi:hypothetical protein